MGFIRFLGNWHESLFQSVFRYVSIIVYMIKHFDYCIKKIADINLFRTPYPIIPRLQYQIIKYNHHYIKKLRSRSHISVSGFHHEHYQGLVIYYFLKSIRRIRPLFCLFLDQFQIRVLNHYWDDVL